MSKTLALIECNEFGNGQAAIEWTLVAGLVIGACAAGFTALGESSFAATGSMADTIEKACTYVAESMKGFPAGSGAGTVA